MSLSLFRANIASVALIAVLACSACFAEPVRVVTEEFSPYNMTVNGRVTGMSTELVEAMLKQAGLQGSIQSMPWARAYDMALNEDSVLIYSMTRNAEREHLFNWVGSLVHTHTNIYSAAIHPIRLHNLDDARSYQIGTVKEDVGEQFLVSKHFEVGRNIQSSNKYEFNYEKLKSGHVDLWISDERNAFYLARQAGDDPDKILVRSLPIDELGDDLNVAFSLNTPPQLVERCRQALVQLHRNGTYDAIVGRWL